MRREVQVRPHQPLLPLVGKAALNLVHRHYIITSLWVCGLIALAFVRGLVVPQERLDEYHRIIRSLDENKLHKLSQRNFDAEELYRSSKGWFSCDSKCQANYKLWKAAESQLRELETKQEATRRKARSVLGILSTFGVEDAKELFWKSFRWGRKFGQRQTFFDMMFLGFRAMNRDESLMSYVLQVLLHFLVNISIGLLTALVGFVFSLWGLIRSYGADFLTGALFFAAATISASAMVATYLLVLYGTAAGTVVMGARALVSVYRLEEAERRARLNHAHQPSQRAHYE